MVRDLYGGRDGTLVTTASKSERANSGEDGGGGRMLAIVPSLGLGIALKIERRSRAAEAVMSELLARFAGPQRTHNRENF
ncbi:MAG: hypothetical protein CM1200mP41_37420 [Gammaproteobacteria bacterium]|nr:MAG: hypothetical protein CM1200mP41_37420 [Gammaproteobacteria bacterium]